MKRLMSILVLLALFGGHSVLTAQYNRISIQTGLFHNFFDGSPMLNVNYTQKTAGVFNGLLHNSLGLQYKRKINTLNALSFEIMGFYNEYKNVYFKEFSKDISSRQFMTYNINYDRHVSIYKKLDFIYGGGICYRNGSDYLALGSYPFGFHFLGRSYSDFGLNLRVGIEYSPLRWLTLYTNFDLLGFVYLAYMKDVRKLQETYNLTNYPNRFDFSWRFGVGFNFGKVREY